MMEPMGSLPEGEASGTVAEPSGLVAEPPGTVACDSGLVVGASGVASRMRRWTWVGNRA